MEKPEYLYETNKELPSEEECPVGIVINLEKRPDHFHCGIAYVLEGKINVLHLATYKQLLHDDDYGNFSHFVKTNLHPKRLKLMAPFCKLVHQKVLDGELKVPYGISYEDYSEIDQVSGELRLSQGTNGLTCSTFVMTMFHSSGFDLIDLKNWPHRDEDKKWKADTLNALVRAMNKWNIPINFIHKLAMEQNLVRYKPQEVAASSALYDNRPADAGRIIGEGVTIKEYMNA